MLTLHLFVVGFLVRGLGRNGRVTCLLVEDMVDRTDLWCCSLRAKPGFGNARVDAKKD